MGKLLLLAILAAGCALPGSALGGGGSGLRAGSGTGIRINDNGATFGLGSFGRSAAAGASAPTQEKAPKSDAQPQTPAQTPPKKPAAK
jgi:hypothetical protein